MSFVIAYLFYTLLFTLPLAMYIHTSELFEFNKIVLLYIFTVLIAGIWVIRMILEKKIIFKRSKLDIPILLFVGACGISTLFSVDFRTSLLGIYSRFNGGFVSLFCYAILYWAWLSNMDLRKTYKALYVLLTASVPVCLYGIGQHFGIDKDLWIQDVQNRIFSTFGQPNWLAAWIVTIMPITWALTYNTNRLEHSFSWKLLSTLLFITLLFTKSRSGLLAFVMEFILFWGFLYLKTKKTNAIKNFLFYCLIFFVVCLFIGTPWTPSIVKTQSKTETTVSTTTSLETGGTESGHIRKIVWKGAFEIWKNNPILGTGLETFAFSYYKYKPAEHNYTSEWDYLYNKAHNEYLNYLATTGTVGIISYLALIAVSIFVIVKSKNDITSLALLSGYISILITNFFGFSVVPISLLFFLFPAMAITLQVQTTENKAQSKIFNFKQKFSIFFVLCVVIYILSRIAQYWYADLLFAKGRNENSSGDPVSAHKTLNHAVELSPNESIYFDEISESQRNIAVALLESGKEEEAKKFAEFAINSGLHSVDLSPANVNLKRNLAATFTMLGAFDQKYLERAHSIVIDITHMAPTDPKAQYSLAASYYRLGKLNEAITEMQKAVEMKKDYKDSRFALAMMYIDAKKYSEAKEELEYILEKIDPKDEKTKKELIELNQTR